MLRADVARRGDYDLSTFHLLPLAYHRLHQHGIDDPSLALLKGVYRKAWCEAEILTRRTAPLIAALETAGVETMLLRGASLGLSYYCNQGLRPMADVDILVSKNQLARARAVLAELDWKPGPFVRAEDVRYGHAMLVLGPGEGRIVLHWHPMGGAGSPRAEKAFWARAQPLRFGAATTRQLAAGDALLHVILSRPRPDRQPSIRWIADAMTILNGAGERIDWDAVARAAVALRASGTLSRRLAFLVERFAAPVPPDRLRQLRLQSMALAERVANGAATRPLAIVADFSRLGPHGGPAGFAIGLSHYLRYRLRLAHRRDLVLVPLRTLSRRVAGARRAAAS